MSHTHLYFIALIPPDDLCKRINSLKHDFAERFDSRKALRVMPHITIKAPVKCPAEEQSALVNWFQELELPLEPFTVLLNGFGTFANKKNPVVFVKPVNNDSLRLLQHYVITSFRKLLPSSVQPVDEDFHPHITIAYRDLTTGNFKKAWTEYQQKEFNSLFEVNTVHLLKHDGSRWNVIAAKMLT